MSSKITVGGQAVIEGVMMRSLDKYVIAVRRPDKKISTKEFPINSSKSKYATLPITRGIIKFAETLVIGVKSITYSANEAVGEEEQLTAKELYMTVAFSVFMTIALFYLLPLTLTKVFTKSGGVFFNLIDGFLRITIFLAYLLGISLLSDVRRLFQYHGAEHKAVHCYEAGKKLTVKNVQSFTTLHPRCGTSFILIVFIISILFFSLFPVSGYIDRLLLRLLLLPVIAGVSYELLRASGKHSEKGIVKFFIYPGLMLQKITTKEPTDDMVEVAIKSLKLALPKKEVKVA